MAVERTDAIIAGVNKAGTTSLFVSLSTHPDVAPSSIKETSYFLPPRYGEPLASASVWEGYFAHAGERAVRLEATPSYFYGAVIAYNDARTPGLGSAIFLHVSHSSSTAGCVALPTDQLLSLLRWLDPARSPVIAIGTQATLTNS